MPGGSGESDDGISLRGRDWQTGTGRQGLADGYRQAGIGRHIPAGRDQKTVTVRQIPAGKEKMDQE